LSEIAIFAWQGVTRGKSEVKENREREREKESAEGF
jgi:hypothetical protein